MAPAVTPRTSLREFPVVEPLEAQSRITQHAAREAIQHGLTLPPAFKVYFVDVPRDSTIHRGETFQAASGGPVDVFVRADLTPDALRQVLLHELQHVHDHGVLFTADRDWLERRAVAFAARVGAGPDTATSPSTSSCPASPPRRDTSVAMDPSADLTTGAVGTPTRDFDPMTFSIRHGMVLLMEVEGFLLTGDLAHALGVLTHSVSRVLAVVAARHLYHADAALLLTALATFRHETTALSQRLRPGLTSSFADGHVLNPQELLRLTESRRENIHVDLDALVGLRDFLTAWSNHTPGLKLSTFADRITRAGQAIRVKPASAKPAPRNLSIVDRREAGAA
jgi:hypothetical protein